MNNKLLCAIDGSHSSDKAVDYAVVLASTIGAHLTFLTVNCITSHGLAHSYFWDSNMLNAADAQIQEELQAAMSKARTAGLTEVSCAIESGHNIAACIINFAGEHGYQHIITGSVGRTGVARVLLGSVAQDVVAKAHCPVTVVR